MNGDDSSEVERLSEEGCILLEAARFDEARALLTRARELAPNNALVHYRLGLLFGDIGQPAEALEALDTSLRLQADNARAHNNRGAALQRLGRMPEAEQAFRRALDLSPDLAPPYINLGHLLEQQGRSREAVALYEQAIARGLDAGVFSHHIAAVAGQVTNRAPTNWVRETFDNFAPNFDSQLELLHYDVPRQLVALLSPAAAGSLDILDLGCGTGQCGVSLSPQKRSLVGVDLSERMLVRARLRAVYDELHRDEVHNWLRGAGATRFDLVIAADVLIYIGALEELFGEAARVLRVGGRFAFSTEECAGSDYTLLPIGRYAQSQAYIERLAESAFDVATHQATVIRIEAGVPIPGRLYVLQKR